MTKKKILILDDNKPVNMEQLRKKFRLTKKEMNEIKTWVNNYFQRNNSDS